MKTSIQIFILSFIFITPSCKKDKVNPPVVADIDGNIYDTIKIGTQVWMKENLRTTRYNDGTPIITGLNDAGWDAATEGAFCDYNDDTANGRIYGKLYNWYAVNTGKLAPKGWHIPSQGEAEALIAYLGGENYAGDKMKSTNLWVSAVGISNTNSSGFTALPAGERTTVTSFYNILGEASFWTITRSVAFAASAYFITLDYNLSGCDIANASDEDGLSVRCIRD